MTTVPAKYEAIVKEAVAGTGLPEGVVVAQINDESGFQPGVVSSAGAEGMFQFLPSTYVGLGFPAGTEDDPNEEVKAYVAYMKQLLNWSGGNVQKALAAYNAGQENWQAGIGYANTILGAAGEPVTFGVAPSGGSSGGGAGGAPTATEDGFNPFGWATGIVSQEFGWFGKVINGVTGIPSTIGDVATSISGLVRGLTKITDLILMLFRPEFWLRVGAFVFAILALGAGLYFFKEAL